MKLSVIADAEDMAIGRTEVKSGNMNAVTIKDQIKEWRERNPLFKWRVKNGLARRDVSALLNTSSNSVIEWERGTTSPSEANMALMARLMRVSIDELTDQWRKWSDTRDQIFND